MSHCHLLEKIESMPKNWQIFLQQTAIRAFTMRMSEQIFGVKTFMNTYHQFIKTKLAIV